jgi:predicted O-methyltransferase YrrM
VAGANARRLARAVRIELGRLVASRRLPRAVAVFHLRARLRAHRIDDRFSLASSAPPDGLARLLALAGERDVVAELGTANGWTAIALALARPSRRVVSVDLLDLPTREGYLSLVSPSVRERIVFVRGDGASAARPCELLFIDSSHEREPTLAEVRAWRPQMGPGGVIVFDDYLHPGFPGVAEAVAELGLSGERDGQFFVHRI